jgi:hypothetical protein
LTDKFLKEKRGSLRLHKSFPSFPLDHQLHSFSCIRPLPTNNAPYNPISQPRPFGLRLFVDPRHCYDLDDLNSGAPLCVRRVPFYRLYRSQSPFSALWYGICRSSV